MDDMLKGIIIVAMLLYIVSPVDFCPGPIDDLIVILISLAANKGISSREGEM